ncbi:MAG: tRNA (adenosine(37)-N6)-threonylcarbamoyltransferase complex dimerization subunit type 1 TsaB [Pirellulales bacterium]
MRILAIETSGRDATLAALESDPGGQAQTLAEVAIVGPERTAQFLAPRLQQLLREADWQPQAVKLVAVAVGPGSFTGLRIGVTTAKTLAYAVGAQVIGVNTLEVIAAQAPDEVGPLWVTMDAQRQELFAARFDAKRRIAVEPQIVTQPTWLQMLQPGDHVTGPGMQRLRVDLPTGVQTVDRSLWQPQAATVGQLGWRDYQAGRRDDLWKLTPLYYRQSAAEEKRDLARG